jgi:hypothetical protein
MNKFLTPLTIILTLFFFSCGSQAKPVPSKSKPPVLIMGKGNISSDKLYSFLVQNNKKINSAYAKLLSNLYIEETAYEGVNHDVAFAQMCLETGYLKFGGLVQPEWNNFCGLGAIGPEQPGLIFPDARTGVRAHIQHLKAYATKDPLNLTLVDPRYKYVRLGSSPAVDGLAGTWAADKMYAIKIKALLLRQLSLSEQIFQYSPGIVCYTSPSQRELLSLLWV